MGIRRKNQNRRHGVRWPICCTMYCLGRRQERRKCRCWLLPGGWPRNAPAAFPSPRDQTPVAPIHVGENVAGTRRRCRPNKVTGRCQSAEIRPNPGLRGLGIVQQDDVILAAGEGFRNAHSGCTLMQIGNVQHRFIIRFLRPMAPICSAPRVLLAKGHTDAAGKCVLAVSELSRPA